MSRPGLVLNHRTGWPTAGEITALGLQGGVVRSIVYDQQEFSDAVDELEGVAEICALLNTETGGVGPQWDGWEQEVTHFADRFAGRVRYVEMGNELDSLGEDPNRGAWAASVAAPILVRAHIQPILTSVAGPNWQQWLAAMVAQLPQAVRGLCWACLHPYGQRVGGFPPAERPLAAAPGDGLLGHSERSPEGARAVRWGFGELDQAVSRAHEISGLPVAVTESGIKLSDAGGEDGQRQYVAKWVPLVAGLRDDVMPFACFFCRNDQIGGPDEQGPQAFGLIRAEGTPRPAWWEMQARLGGSGDPFQGKEPDGPKFVLGFKAAHDSDLELVGDPLEDEAPPKPGVYLNTQRTTNGLLFWSRAQRANESGYEEVLGFADYTRGGRYLWDGQRLVRTGSLRKARGRRGITPRTQPRPDPA